MDNLIIVQEGKMLQIRPSCENCDKELPVDSREAMICTYECTFCVSCVENILENVCPNCGGGFVNRPIRPLKSWRKGVSREHQPPTTKRTYKPVDTEDHKVFAANIKTIPPHKR